MNNIIEDSELILREDGAVYHLNLLPEDISDLIILVGDPDRVSEVSKHFDSLLVIKKNREFVTHTGYIGNKKLTVISTGIGPDNIDIVINELDALYNVNLKRRIVNDVTLPLKIIRLGTSGALQTDIEVDSIVMSSHGLGMDNLMHYYAYTSQLEDSLLLDRFKQHMRFSESNPIQPYIFEGSVGLRNHFLNRFSQGITVTCPGFYAPQGRSIRAPIAFPDLINSISSFEYRDIRITNFEMETSAIYGLCRILKHQCLSINTIIANRTTKTFSKDYKKSVNNMIVQSLDIIVNIP